MTKNIWIELNQKLNTTLENNRVAEKLWNLSEQETGIKWKF